MSAEDDREQDRRYEELHLVYSGSYSEVLALQATLGAQGVWTTIGDETMKRMDPFLTGGNALDCNLMAHAGDLPRVRQLIEKASPLPQAPESDGPTTSQERLEEWSRRIRWASLLIITAPYGLYLGFEYLRTVADTGQRAHQHVLTVAGIVLALIVTLLYGAIAVREIAHVVRLF